MSRIDKGPVVRTVEGAGLTGHTTVHRDLRENRWIAEQALSNLPGTLIEVETRAGSNYPFIRRTPRDSQSWHEVVPIAADRAERNTVLTSLYETRILHRPDALIPLRPEVHHAQVICSRLEGGFIAQPRIHADIRTDF